MFECLFFFFLKDFMTWLVCKMLSDILFLRAGSLRCFCNYHVGRHVEINLKLIHMASGIKTYTLGAMLND